MSDKTRAGSFNLDVLWITTRALLGNRGLKSHKTGRILVMWLSHLWSTSLHQVFLAVSFLTYLVIFFSVLFACVIHFQLFFCLLQSQLRYSHNTVCLVMNIIFAEYVIVKFQQKFGIFLYFVGSCYYGILYFSMSSFLTFSLSWPVCPSCIETFLYTHLEWVTCSSFEINGIVQSSPLR